ncbi:MAG TPA: ribose 5-phosphate isomerase B [Candidatus Obscuribacterales bacterium]
MSEKAKVALGSDHAGFELKEKIKEVLDQMQIAWTDLGTNSTDSCDYPDYARKVAEVVSNGRCERGIICCGSGIGVSIVANKVRRVRAALCHDVEQAQLSRRHNDANVLCLSGRTLDASMLKAVIEAWLTTDFEGGRHEVRVSKIEKPRQGEGVL